MGLAHHVSPAKRNSRKEGVLLPSRVSSPNAAVAHPGASGGDVGDIRRVMEGQLAGAKGCRVLWEVTSVYTSIITM